MRHIVDAQTDHVLRGAGDGALQGDGFHRQRGDAADGQLQAEPHLWGEEGDGIGQGLVGEPQPAQRPDLCAVLREDGGVLHTVRQAAGDKTHTVSLLSVPVGDGVADAVGFGFSRQLAHQLQRKGDRARPDRSWW